MKETVRCRYQKSFQDTYLIISECDRAITESYFGKISLKEHLKGLLPCELRQMDGVLEAWYPVSSLQAFAQAFSVKELRIEDLRGIILQIIRISKELERFLLDGRQLCFLPEYIFWQMDTRELLFLFDYTEVKEKSDISSLAAFILERTCHEDEKAVELSYFFYECCCKDNFSIKEVETFLEERLLTDTCAMTPREEEPPERPGELMEQGQSVPREVFDSELRKEEEKTVICNKTDGRRFWRNNHLMTGIGLVLLSLVLFAGFQVAELFFLLTQKEKLIWFLVSALMFLYGMWTGLSGIRTYTEKGKPTLHKTDNPEAELFQNRPDHLPEIKFDDIQDKEAKESEPCDGRTVYIGSQVRDRSYELLYRKKGREEIYAISSFPFLLGKEKGSVNLPIRDVSVSRIHARFLQEDGILYLEDMHSTNGTFVNDLPLQPHERITVKRGDILQFGRAEFILQ